MDDVIYRQAAIDAIKKFQHGAAEWRDEQEERSDIWHRADSAIASAIEIGLRVKKIPSARKKGHWVKAEGMMPPEYHGHYFCSECEEWAPRDWKKHKTMLSSYCPHCGADMRGEEDG